MTAYFIATNRICQEIDIYQENYKEWVEDVLKYNRLGRWKKCPIPFASLNMELNQAWSRILGQEPPSIREVYAIV